MCKPGNQSIFKGCADVIIKKFGSLSNQEMRQILKQHGGCMKK